MSSTNPKQRYALLAGPTYYPPPGWTAFIETGDDLPTLTETGKEKAEEYYGWWQIVDLETLQIVAGEGQGHTGLFGMFKANPNTETLT